jgi:hypothetical protein
MIGSLLYQRPDDSFGVGVLKIHGEVAGFPTNTTTHSDLRGWHFGCGVIARSVIGLTTLGLVALSRYSIDASHAPMDVRNRCFHAAGFARIVLIVDVYGGYMIRLLVLPLVVVLAGCSSPVPEPPPPAPSARNGVVGSQALSYTLAPVAARVLCGALPPERLQQVLGVSAIKVTPDPTGGVASCALSTSEIYVDIRLELDQGFEPTETIAGKPVQVLPSSGQITSFDVAIAESVGPAWPNSTQTPILRVSGAGGKVAVPEIRRLIEELVPALARQADSLPPISPDGTVAFAPVPFTAAWLFDLPTPVQGLRLCSLMKEKFGRAHLAASQRSSSTRTSSSRGRSKASSLSGSIASRGRPSRDSASARARISEKYAEVRDARNADRGSSCAASPARHPLAQRKAGLGMLERRCVVADPGALLTGGRSEQDEGVVHLILAEREAIPSGRAEDDIGAKPRTSA